MLSRNGIFCRINLANGVALAAVSLWWPTGDWSNERQRDDNSCSAHSENDEMYSVYASIMLLLVAYARTQYDEFMHARGRKLKRTCAADDT